MGSLPISWKRIRETRVTTSWNTTVQNHTKSKKLSESHILPKHHASGTAALDYLGGLNPCEYETTEDRQALLYSVGMALLGNQLSAVAGAVLSEYETDILPVPQVPEGCFDLLGTIYQYVN